MERICTLEKVVGRIRACPFDACPFWEPGGAVLQGRCAFEHLDLEGRPDIAAELLRVRDELQADGREETRQAFYRLLNDCGD
jgi:hypothetical protein